MEERKGNILLLSFIVSILVWTFSVFNWFSDWIERPVDIEVPHDVANISSDKFPSNPQSWDPKVLFWLGSDFDRMKKQGNTLTKNPAIQPILNSTYDINSNRMIAYMKDNAFKIQLNTPIKNGYLYFRIKTTSSTGGKLFFYLAKDKYTWESWYIDINSAVYSKYNPDKTYDLLFDIGSIKFLPCGGENIQTLDLIKKLSYFWRANYVSTFWVNNENSYIEEITLAYDEDR